MTEDWRGTAGDEVVVVTRTGCLVVDGGGPSSGGGCGKKIMGGTGTTERRLTVGW